MTPAEEPERGLRGLQRLLLWGSAAALLIAPAVAMRLTTAVVWGPEDFAALALMLLIAGGAFELAAWRTQRVLQRALTGVAIAVTILLIWAQLAVGIFS